MKTYWKAQCLILLLALSSIAAFNRLVDPYGYFFQPVLEGWNERKTAFRAREREAKSYRYRQTRPHTVILGSSRAASGLPAEHPLWAGDVYNFSLSGAGVRQTEQFILPLLDPNHTRRVFFFIDFFTFNDHYSLNNLPTPETPLAISLFNTRFNDLFTIGTLKDSLQTLREQGNHRKRALDAKGFWTGRGLNHLLPPHQAFEMLETGMLDESFFPKNAPPFNISDKQRGLRSFEAILEYLHRQHIETTLIINPEHARFFVLYAAGNILDQYWHWKQALVDINARVASHHGSRPFALIDFSGIHAFTAEPLPEDPDSRQKMQWFPDPSHYNIELGNILLDCMATAATCPAGFAAPLSTDTIEAHLHAQQLAVTAYLAEHDALIAHYRNHLSTR